MSNSKKLKLLVKREDTEVVERIEVEEDKQIFDLLKLCRALLKFGKNAKLCVYKEGDEKYLSEAFYLRDMKDAKVLIIKDKNIDEEEKYKKDRAEKDKENRAKAKEKRENIAKNLKNDKEADNGDSFREQFAKEEPKSSPAEHQLQKDLKEQMMGTDTSTTMSRDSSEDEEIKILTRKINSEGLCGFEYEIIPESYADDNRSISYERSFSSEEEQRSTQSKVNSTSDWSSWKAELGFSAWGVSVSSSVGQDTSVSNKEGIKTQRTRKTRIAVATKTSFHQMKNFRVKVKLGEKAIADAKKILKVNMHNKHKSINKFNKKYCSLVYSGQFFAGGWFRTVATASSSKDMDFIALENEAKATMETHWSVGASGWGVEAGGGQDKGTSNQTNNQQSHQRTSSTVQVQIRKESAPGKTSSENELENKIKDPKMWTISPVIGGRKSDFIPVYELIRDQAEATGDKELLRVSLVMRLYMKGTFSLMENFQSVPYVVLIGDVGTGKSTVVEKLTGVEGRSSNANTSYTRSSDVFWVPDGSLIIADTPGSNALVDKFQHNIWIAGALNFMPVSRIFIVVKAEPRIDTVVDNIRKFADCFVELPLEILGVLVTHMDKVGWTGKDLTPSLDEDLGITTVIFSWIDIASEKLLHDILQNCTEESHNLTIDDENFFKLFQIHSNHRKILTLTSAEVKNFRAKKKAFDLARKEYSGKDLVDLVFEFQAYMTEEIAKARKRFSDANDFTFMGEDAANQAGHVANMVNQLRVVLYDIRTECVGFQSAHGVSELRRCPHCDLIWTRVEGCDGTTKCGERPSKPLDIRDSSFAVLANFTFEWSNEKLDITKSGSRELETQQSDDPSVGCGNTIIWRDMKPVDLPPEFQETVAVCTNDIKVLPSSAKNFRENLRNQINAASMELELKENPFTE